MNNSSVAFSELSSQQTELIRESAVKAEKEGKLTKAQLNLIYELGMFKMFVPLAFGGKQTPLPEALKLIESVSAADGSLGWTVVQCALAGWMSAFTKDDSLQARLSNNKLCVAGTYEVTGTAERSKSGYTLNAVMNYITGSAEADLILANCRVSENGASSVVSFLIPRSDVDVQSTWNAMGLSATGSNTCVIKNLAIGKDQAFVIGNDGADTDSPLYRFPLVQLTEAARAISVAGMASHFGNLCEELFAARGIADADSFAAGQLRDVFDKHNARMLDAHTKLYYAVDLSWQACVHNQKVKEAILYKVSSGANELVKRAREFADAILPYCGLPAVDKSSEINRVWRDLHTAGQDKLLVYGLQ